MFYLFIKISFFISFFVKALLHTYICKKSGVFIQGMRGFSILTLWFVTQSVNEEYSKHKRLCNYLQCLNMILFIYVSFCKPN